MLKRSEEEIMKNWQGDISKPLVSVCIITYNHEKYIAEALDSFLMQETDFPFEIVVDDDCSTDDNAEIIKEYADKFPNIIKANVRTQNVGIYTNYIENMQRAKGKYIALCEGDDYWTDPFKLQKQVDFLEENLDYGLVCTDMTRYNQKDKTYSSSNIIPLGQLSPYSKITKEGSVYEELMNWRSQIWTLTVCFRKSLIHDLPILDDSKYFTGDRLLFIHISLKSKIKYFEESTAVYRILEESASHFIDPLKSLEFLYKISNLMLYFLDKHPVNNQLHQIVFYRSMFVKFQFALASGKYDIFKTVKLKLPSSPSYQMIGFKTIYFLCKFKPFYKVFSYVYKKRVYAPYKKIKIKGAN